MIPSAKSSPAVAARAFENHGSICLVPPAKALKITNLTVLALLFALLDLIRVLVNLRAESVFKR